MTPSNQSPRRNSRFNSRHVERRALRKQASEFFTTRRTADESEAEAAAISEIRAFVARLSADPSAEPPSLP